MQKHTSLSLLDNVLVQFDQALRTLSTGNKESARPSPATTLDEPELTIKERRQAAALMRINHTGEVCAQALYQGQSMTARLEQVRDAMHQAAREETDHLAWCEQRLEQLQGRTSLLNPAWYALSFGVGAIAGLAGDKWSLGFVAETEDQVCRHLESHVEKLPESDERSKVILEQMIIDERSHGETAREAGAANLPDPIKKLMAVMSQVMKKTVYRI